MNLKNFSNVSLKLFFFGAALLCLAGFSSLDAKAQGGSTISVDKTVCDSVGQQSTCNGRINNLDGQTINFTVFQATGTSPNTPPAGLSQLAVIPVTINEGNGSQGRGRMSGFNTGDTVLVCETVPGGFDTLPRPDESTGGQQTREGDCIRVTLGPGNNVLEFINFLEDLAPTAAPAKISGRVLDSKGRAVSRVSVVIVDSNGLSQVSTTNSFGHYKFENLASGETYIIGGFHKRFTFTPIVVNLTDNLAEHNLRVQ